MKQPKSLFENVKLPCGVVLKNRIAKSAMSDSLGYGTGHPTAEQNRLYQRWVEGGVAISIIGEVQPTPNYAEKPGNLVLNSQSDFSKFQTLAKLGSADNTLLFVQLGHAGALAYAPISTPKGPSPLDLIGLKCEGMSKNEIQNVPQDFAQMAQLAQRAGFGGVQIHAAHGFLLSQFLSPLFNQRNDEYGGDIGNRMRLLLDSIQATRAAVGPGFPIAVKLNSSDQLQGGLSEDDALQVVAALDKSSVDLIDISGGTYFPGAKSVSDSAGGGPYFIAFARRARQVTSKPLMLTGGFKTMAQAQQAILDGAVDVIGLARALALEPSLPAQWMENKTSEPAFPRFPNAPEGGITAWYTMRLTQIGHDNETGEIGDLGTAVKEYEQRDAVRTDIWTSHFGSVTG